MTLLFSSIILSCNINDSKAKNVQYKISKVTEHVSTDTAKYHSFA